MGINAQASSEILNHILKTKSAHQKVTKAVLMEIGRRLVDYSPRGNPDNWSPPYWPKGYVPGLFCNNWQLGIDSVPGDGLSLEAPIDVPDETGSGSLERLSHLGRWTVGHQYYFTNNLPYAEELELGYSNQAPYGMIAKVEMELPQIVRDAVMNYSTLGS